MHKLLDRSGVCIRRKRCVYLAIVLIFFSNSLAAIHAQVATPTPLPSPGGGTQLTVDPATAQVEQLDSATLDAQVEAILAEMSPADRVGQLFVVTFAGDEVSFNSEITRLIYDYRIGGVALSPKYRNFSNAKGVDTPHQVARLTNQLQALAFGVLLPAGKTPAADLQADTIWPPPGLVLLTSRSGAPPPNLPLLIAVEQVGDGLPMTALRRDFTPLPSQMAIGATWNVDLARKVGRIVGQELRAVGVNVLLGPNLDVFDQPRADSVGALSLHSFGGNPYWVGQMGRAYIAGVHEGGNGHVATIAGHFPGQGTIDRLPDHEIATVQLGLDELRQTALAPFRNVTRQTSIILRRNGDLATTDGLMTSHMRYNALPGRATPISLGPELSMTLEQEDFANWHANGGALMSSPIGIPAIRRYYDASLQEFSPRQVALDVFSAGHDLIFLSQLSLDNDWVQEYQAVKEVIGFFQERYSGDPDFAAQVDAAVRRILRLKLRLYGTSYVQTPGVDSGNVITPTSPLSATAPITVSTDITLPVISAPEVLVAETNLAVLTGTVRADALTTIGQVARESLTLLSPDLQNLPVVLPTAPQADDHLLIFSDSRLLQECAQCTAEATLGPDDIAAIINRFYGSNATGQVLSENVVSHTFSDLDQLLGSLEAQTPVETPTASTALTLTVSATPATAGIAPAGEIEESESITQSTENLDKIAKLQKLIDDSSWLIFVMLDIDPVNAPNSDVVKRFLNQYTDRLEGKKVIVFALHAPYFLDATEISKLSAYFGVYGKTKPFLESAVRALFRSYSPTGAPPVSVPGTSYSSLSERLQPDPRRTIELHVLIGDSELLLQPDEQQRPLLNVGDVIRLRAGPVLDRNGRPIPDGAPVNFNLTYDGEAIALNLEPSLTRNGVASREVTLDHTGALQIAATVGGATTGEPIMIDVQDASESVAAPTPLLVQTVAVTATATPTVVITTTVTASPPSTGPEPLLVNGQRINWITLAIALVTIVITLSLLLIAQIQILPRQVLVHNMLWATIFGLGAYILYGMGLLPGIGLLQRQLDVLGPAVVVFVAMLLPLLWLQLRTEQSQ